MKTWKASADFEKTQGDHFKEIIIIWIMSFLVGGFIGIFLMCWVISMGIL